MLSWKHLRSYVNENVNEKENRNTIKNFEIFFLKLNQ